MKQRIQGIIIGMLISTVLFNGFVYAAQNNDVVQRIFNNIKITLNGNEIIPKDVNGNSVEPFIIDGTTYLPVRAIGNALGLNVDWDSSTNTVVLSDTQYKAESEYPEAEYIKGEVVPLYINPKLEYKDNKLNVLSYEKKYDKSFFLKMYGEFSNMGNYFVKLDTLYDIYPSYKEELSSKLSNMEINLYENEPYVMLVNIIQYFKQRNVEFDIKYNDEFAYVVME